MENPRSAPTGCFKCGRPGHWSRDCPDAPKSDHPIPNPSSTGGNFAPNQLPRPEMPKKEPKNRSRPKLTPELLLSDDGIGYILRHFPRAFRYRGRGHEVSDLGNLIGLYREWHKHLLPYHSFDQFVHKVDKVASSKRVKNCIRDLRERVASGGDPTKLHESPDEVNGTNDEQGNTEEVRNQEGQTNNHYEGDHFANNHYEGDQIDEMQEDMLNEIYQQVSEGPSHHDIDVDMAAAEEHQRPNNGISCSGEEHQRPNNGISCSGEEHQRPNNGISCSSEVHITEEQRARMEANKLKALERAAASSSSSEIQITEEQRARIEANRLKALERAAAARARSLQST